MSRSIWDALSVENISQIPPQRPRLRPPSSQDLGQGQNQSVPNWETESPSVDSKGPEGKEILMLRLSTSLLIPYRVLMTGGVSAKSVPNPYIQKPKHKAALPNSCDFHA